MLLQRHIIHKHNISLHIYADDTHLYFSYETRSYNQLTNLNACFKGLKNWFSHIFSNSNTDKYEVIIIGPDSKYSQIKSQPAPPNYKNIGPIIDINLINLINQQVKLAAQTCFIQFRRISKIR